MVARWRNMICNGRCVSIFCQRFKMFKFTLCEFGRRATVLLTSGALLRGMQDNAMYPLSKFRPPPKGHVLLVLKNWTESIFKQTLSPASYTDVSLSMKMCTRKGRREGDNGRDASSETQGQSVLFRLPSVPFPWSLAVHHHSLAFHWNMGHTLWINNSPWVIGSIIYIVHFLPLIYPFYKRLILISILQNGFDTLWFIHKIILYKGRSLIDHQYWFGLSPENRD